MAIRYDRQFNKQIRRIVDNFNKKIKRLERADHAILPNRVLVSDLKKDFTNRNDLKRELRRLELFTEKNMEQIITIGEMTATRWQFEIDKQRARDAKANLTKEINKIESAGELTPRTSDYLQNLQFRRNYLNKPLKSLSSSQLRTRKKIIDQDEQKERKQQTFYHNLFDMLFKIGYQTNADQADVIYIMEKLSKLTPHQLSEAIASNAALKNFVEKYQIYASSSEESSAENDVVEAIRILKDAVPSILEYYSKM